MGKLLFEIGAEEIPARFIPMAIAQLEQNLKKITSDNRINVYSIKTFATPRRIALMAEIADEQESQEKTVWGPPANVAFDENGNPKQAAYAFANAQGVDIKDLKVLPKGKGNYVCVVLKEKAKKTEEVLPDILKNLFLSLNFPKMMRWGSGSLKFVRPVKWLLCLYEDRLISFEIDGIKSDTKTSGHRFLYESELNIKSPDDYKVKLEEAFVIPDQGKRKNIIVTQLKELAKGVNGEVFWDDELLEEVIYLVEFPNAVLCSFSEEYLKLPEELLITVMKDHQRYFAITSSGKLKNFFIVISNTNFANEENIKKGAERVIRARFEDARFYFEEDLKKGLDRLLELTKGIVYHKKLGSLYDKTQRIINIGSKIIELIAPEKTESFQLTAKYCKADLASGVVGEFPELQGIMGGYYAKHAGLAEEICLAIREHYLPKGFNDAIPSNEIGCILSIADKLDHISSFFYLGEIPTGTEDPFGLRRAANGIIAILLNKRYPISILQLVSMLEYEDDLKEKVATFIGQRFESFLETVGFDVNLIRTVADIVLTQPPHEIEHRLNIVNDFIKKEKFEEFFLAVKRVSNIIRNYEKMPLNQSLFVTVEEKELYQKMNEINEKVSKYMEEHKFEEVLEELYSLTPFINKFFDNVLVMDKDENIKINRIGLLQRLSEKLKFVADLSKLY